MIYASVRIVIMFRRDAMRYVCCHNVFVRPSVCPSVRHDLLLCRNGWTDCRHPFTAWQPHQHGFLWLIGVTNFRRITTNWGLQTGV